MNLKEKIKKWKRNWYELSIDELKKKQKKARQMELLFGIAPLLFYIYTIYITFTSSINVTALIIVIILAFFSFLLLIYLHMCSLDYHRDKCDLNILIYLKQKLEVEK